MIIISNDFSNTINYLTKLSTLNITNVLEKYGQQGVEALSKNTPIDSGETSMSWSYKIESTNGRQTITWLNSNVVNGVNIAIILQYGHGCGNGGYVEGRDYINPTIKPIFDNIANEVWKEVMNK